MSKKVLEMKQIEKKFPGVYALKGVDFDLFEGEVHALLGENGAGKSTLMKVLNGIYDPDGGEIFIEGEKVSIESVNDAKAKGISIIHQELVLVPHMKVYENIFLGREKVKGAIIDQASMIREAKALLDSFQLNISPTETISNLTIAQQQMIEIIKAISVNAKVIAMDEPTSSLSDNEVEFLFDTIEHLKKEGVGIIYISHRMKEIFQVSDRITVMRDGAYVGTVDIDKTSEAELIRMMVGRPLEKYYHRTYNENDEVVLEVKNLSKKGVFHDVNFQVMKGEVLGFSGLVGAGRSEIMKCIFGIDKYDSGEIHVNGHPAAISNPKQAIAEDIVYVPENRKEEGLFLIDTVQYNMTISILKEFLNKLRVNRRYEDTKTKEYIDFLNIRTPSYRQIVGNLSGGNQQKVLISRWLLTKPKVLILDEPTKGIDVGAKSEIYSIINDLAQEGVSIIMVSSDLPEVINMSDRVAVVYQGSIQKIIDRHQATQERIMHYATGGKDEE